MATMPCKVIDRCEEVFYSREAIIDTCEGVIDSCVAVYRESARGQRCGKHRHGH